MTFDHVVKYNGQYYAAWEDVPIDKSLPNNYVRDDMELPFSDKEIELETKSELHKYTYEELEQMTAKEMRKLAEDKGFKLTKAIREDIINEFLSKQ